MEDSAGDVCAVIEGEEREMVRVMLNDAALMRRRDGQSKAVICCAVEEVALLPKAPSMCGDGASGHGAQTRKRRKER